jgi:hypothetical protein
MNQKHHFKCTSHRTKKEKPSITSNIFIKEVNLPAPCGTTFCIDFDTLARSEHCGVSVLPSVYETSVLKGRKLAHREECLVYKHLTQVGLTN